MPELTHIDPETLVTVRAWDFTAGAVLIRGHVVRAAPRLKWALGLSAEAFSDQISERGWRAGARACPAAPVLDPDG